jgi:hypothetical protein
LGDASLYFEGQARDFTYTAAAHDQLVKKAPIVAMVLKNLSSDCKTKAQYVNPLRVVDAPFRGSAQIDSLHYNGRYTGTLTTTDGVARLDIVLGAAKSPVGETKIHAEVSQDGRLLSYSISSH